MKADKEQKALAVFHAEDVLYGSPMSREWRIWRMVCCIRVRQNCFKGQEIQCNDGLNNKEASSLKRPRRQSRVDMTVL